MYEYWEEDLQYQEYQKSRQKEKRLEKKEIAGEMLRVICDAEDDVPTRLRENAHLEKLGQCRLADLSAICRRNHVMAQAAKTSWCYAFFCCANTAALDLHVKSAVRASKNLLSKASR